MHPTIGPKIGIIGLGTMGLGIAQVFAQAGFPTIVTDAYQPARANARERMEQALNARIASGKLTPEARDATLANLHIAESLTEFAACALIIEAIVERLDAKQSLFASLEAVIPASTILATNTSSIPVASIASTAQCPDRILALHFFNPPTAMKLVELAPHAGTSDAALTLARAITEAAGKTTIQCPDRPGFIVNRCARPYYGEALALLAEGHSAEEIDAAMMAAGYRLGPFALIDLIGADINLAATEGLSAAMQNHPRYHVFPALKAQVASGNLGRKSGQGFIHPAQTLPKTNPEIALRIESTLINEAAWLLNEGGATPEGIDTAMKLGLNFPRGPFEALAQHTAAKVLAILQSLAAQAPANLKLRYAPAPFLTR
ncbi:MAG: 3-hydroxyacyl-CoA dehydrogenase NAD-binding domain-containing protein [Cypionkella sp.]|uniref:3-hydroxyacyl-CoA dehydrogenase n=1 Tax=Cypionkella sp. TaxID=2811411 RepID=UPI002ABC9A4C|nr:3-hydroxyacyl-CoA dehydrogenase NAD-binding domain-containing protein [Cypionkella sp.]MDZ4311892.1 3-hydroxyacyl-CoA dehydrogenase NAD-binding domain-containing protein [Cypionkella sp.]